MLHRPPKEPRSRWAVLASIQPVFAEAILNGAKTVELRRTAPQLPAGGLMIVYATMPVAAIIGHVAVLSIDRMTPGNLWRAYHRRAHIGRSEFDNYFADASVGYALNLGGAVSWPNPVSLADMRAQFSISPPQSWRYLDEHITALLETCAGVSQH